MRDEWDAINYPELTPAENDEIRVARRAGYASMYPAYPNAEAQARDTLTGARTFLGRWIQCAAELASKDGDASSICIRDKGHAGMHCTHIGESF